MCLVEMAVRLTRHLRGIVRYHTSLMAEITANLLAPINFHFTPVFLGGNLNTTRIYHLHHHPQYTYTTPNTAFWQIIN